MTESFPRQKALTRGFRLGAPRSFRLSAEHDLVLFIRSDSGRSAAGNLWCAQPEAPGSTTWIERKIVDSSALANSKLVGFQAKQIPYGFSYFSSDDELCPTG
jgi:hypothetical protein